jgi:hypothetical protein
MRGQFSWSHCSLQSSDMALRHNDHILNNEAPKDQWLLRVPPGVTIKMVRSAHRLCLCLSFDSYKKCYCFPTQIGFKARWQNCEKRLLASSCLSPRLSVHSHGITRLPLDRFSWNMISVYFSEKSVGKIQVSLKYDKNNGYFTWRHKCIYDNKSLNSSLKCDMFKKEVVYTFDFALFFFPKMVPFFR